MADRRFRVWFGDRAASEDELRRIEEEVLEDHVGHCVEAAIRSGNRDDQRKKVAELMEVVARAGR